MLIYFFIIIISFICAFAAEKFYEKGYKKSFYFLSALAVLIPSLMAGFRASGVGTDTRVYVDRVFEYMVTADSFSDISYFMTISDVEPCYLAFNFIVSRFGSSLTLIYFALSLFINLLFYTSFVGYYKRDKIPFCLSYLFFLLILYNKSFNMVRQMMVMAICFYGTRYIYEKKVFKYLLIIFVAFFFHRTAVLFLPLYYLTMISDDTKKSLAFKLCIIFGIVFCVFFMRTGMSFLIEKGLLNEKYNVYLTNFAFSNNIKPIEWVPKIAIGILLLLFNKKLCSISSNNNNYIFLFFIECATFLFGLNSLYAQRISYYFMPFICLLLAQFYRVGSKNKDKLLLMLISILFVFAYSYLYYDFYQFDQTIPYIMDLNK